MTTTERARPPSGAADASARADRWKSRFDAWAGQDPYLASTGEPSNPEEMASVGLVLGDWLGLDGSQRVLDVGCASGTLTGMWAHRAADVHALDFSYPLLADAASRQGDAGLRLVNAEAGALPFADGSFDCVACYGVLLCLPDHAYVDRTIDEMIRVARQDARLLLGSMPDLRCKDVFFDHCDAMTAWYRRSIPRRWRWLAKRMLKPSCEPGRTEILWFDIEALAADLRRRGFHVDVECDPEYSNYAAYRKTILLSRRATGSAAP